MGNGGLAVWSHLSPRNLLALQRKAAIEELDRRIRDDWQHGYGLDVDELLERRHKLQCLIDEAK